MIECSYDLIIDEGSICRYLKVVFLFAMKLRLKMVLNLTKKSIRTLAVLANVSPIEFSH